MKRWAILAFVGVLIASCTRSSGPDADEATLTVDGSATVQTDDGTETVTGKKTLQLGDRVTMDAGTAVLEFADGSEYELRAGEPGTSIELAAPPVLTAGDLLVVDGFPASVVVDTATLTALGVVEVDADEPLATAFTGNVTIAGLGDLEALPGLRQVLLTPSALPEPAVYDGSDPWDRRYLGEAIAFGERLESLARGYTNDLRGGAPGASFFEAVIPALAEEREFTRDLLDDRPAGETLVGAAIAVQGRQDTFRTRWLEIFTFRDAGAVWGLVALDQGVSSAPVLETIEFAVAESPLSDRPRPTSSTTSTTTTTTTTIPGTGPTSTTTTTTTEPPDDGPIPPFLDPIGDTLQDLLDGLGLG